MLRIQHQKNPKLLPGIDVLEFNSLRGFQRRHHNPNATCHRLVPTSPLLKPAGVMFHSGLLPSRRHQTTWRGAGEDIFTYGELSTLTRCCNPNRQCCETLAGVLRACRNVTPMLSAHSERWQAHARAHALSDWKLRENLSFSSANIFCTSPGRR